uniref:Uncharacterized protein n=1 Tax=Setaria italica TaxID=4555 RepID=K3YF78_SETIT
MIQYILAQIYLHTLIRFHQINMFTYLRVARPDAGPGRAATGLRARKAPSATAMALLHP